MAIRAVVFDVGDVLERVGDHAWPETWAARWGQRAGLGRTALEEAFAQHGPLGDVLTGAVTEQEFRAYYAGALRLDAVEADRMMAELWDAYCGELDAELYSFYTSLRGHYRLGILSNSMDGARREEQRRYAFLEDADVVVYSHEVGLAKPDPAIFALTTERLGVAPEETAFLDDSEANVAGARGAGWHAVRHADTADSIRALRELLQPAG